MRIVLFTVEETQYVPLLLDAVLEQRGSQIVAAFVSRSLFKKWLRRLPFLIRNRYPFCIRAGDWFRFAQLRVSRRRATPDGSHSILTDLRNRGIPAEYLWEIDTAGTLRMLKALEPDVFLFCPFDKIAGPEFLKTPKLGTFNVHLGKLPEYRGGLSAFWTLRFGDKEAGATLHRAVKKLDAGEIVKEVRIPVKTKSMHQLMLDTVQAASPMVVQALDLIESRQYQPVDKSGRRESYHSMPGYEDFQAFYARGCRLI